MPQPKKKPCINNIGNRLWEMVVFVLFIPVAVIIIVADRVDTLAYRIRKVA